jgi:hypothetical protein
MLRLGTGTGFAARSCPRSFRSASVARFGQDDGGENEPPPFLVERRENYPEVSRRAARGEFARM